MKKVLILLSVVVSSMLADIGKITALKGTASLIHADITQSIKLGTILDVHDEIKTDAKSKLQIVFKDKTVISLGQNSHFKIDEYLYEDTKVAANFSVKKGFFKSITGRIGKIAPKRFKIKTANATIGVRGTTVIGEVREKVDIIACSSGQIVVSNQLGSRVVNAGERTIVDSMKMPREAKKINKVLLKQLDSKSDVKEVEAPVNEKPVSINNEKTIKDSNLADEKSADKLQPWVDSVDDFIPSKYESALGTKTPTYSGDVTGKTSKGDITDGRVNLNFNLGNGKVDGDFKFDDTTHEHYDIGVVGKMRSDSSFELSAKDAYYGKVNGKLGGEKYNQANGDFQFIEKDVEGNIYNKIDGKFNAKQNK